MGDTQIQGAIRTDADENGNAKVYVAGQERELEGKFTDEQLQTLEGTGAITRSFPPKKVTEADLAADPTIRAGNAKDKRNRNPGPNEKKHFIAGQPDGGDNEGKVGEAKSDEGSEVES